MSDVTDPAPEDLGISALQVEVPGTHKPVPFDPAPVRPALDRELEQIRQRVATVALQISEDPDAPAGYLTELRAELAGRLRNLADEIELGGV